MGTEKKLSIDALFGSKTRVKLLYLFLNNPEKSFYVREITRLVDEQINSVRRELANMMRVGIVLSDSAENKLYYRINQGYEFYVPFRAIFSDEKVVAKSQALTTEGQVSRWQELLGGGNNIRVAIAAGVLVKGSASAVDLLVVSNSPKKEISALINKFEQLEEKELNYSVLTYDEFYYRLSVRDKFITEILSGKYIVVVDEDGVVSGINQDKGDS